VAIRVPIHREADERVLARLCLLSPLLQERRAGSLVLSGGDTALLVCGWLRARGILLRGELEPGMPWGTLVGGVADGIVVCTKPGGFGDDNSLLRVVPLLTTTVAE
jgi:uncharacterized protein YgbK (DUF1537 family)